MNTHTHAYIHICICIHTYIELICICIKYAHMYRERERGRDMCIRMCKFLIQRNSHGAAQLVLPVQSLTIAWPVWVVMRHV